MLHYSNLLLDTKRLILNQESSYHCDGNCTQRCYEQNVIILVGVLDKTLLIQTRFLSFGATTRTGTVLFHVPNVAVFTKTLIFPSGTMFVHIWIVPAFWFICWFTTSATTIQFVDLEKVGFVHSIILSQSALLGWPNFILGASNICHGGFVSRFLEGPRTVLHYRGGIVGASLIRATLALHELAVHAFLDVVPMNFDIFVTISSRLLVPPA